MNKCITVLDKAAQEYAGRIVGNDEDSNYAEWFNVYKEKFAELLIKECLLQIADVRIENDFEPVADAALVKGLTGIRKHFGVAE